MGNRERRGHENRHSRREKRSCVVKLYAVGAVVRSLALDARARGARGAGGAAIFLLLCAAYCKPDCHFSSASWCKVGNQGGDGKGCVRARRLRS